MLVAFGALAVNGFNYALDFTGGTVAELQLRQAGAGETVRQRLQQAGFESAVVQTFGSGDDIVVRLKPARRLRWPPNSGQAIAVAAQTADNPAKLLRSESVGPQIGKELAINGMKAAIFVVLGFLAYIWIRFEWRFAVAALVTTLHDVVLVAGWFAISGHEFDLTVLAGLLSVMGFSINDTIVVFDRVRENFRTLHKLSAARSAEPLDQPDAVAHDHHFLRGPADRAGAVLLRRRVAASGMAESQIIGIIFGTVSSIFVACPLLLGPRRLEEGPDAAHARRLRARAPPLTGSASTRPGSGRNFQSPPDTGLVKIPARPRPLRRSARQGRHAALRWNEKAKTRTARSVCAAALFHGYETAGRRSSPAAGAIFTKAVSGAD